MFNPAIFSIWMKCIVALNLYFVLAYGFLQEYPLMWSAVVKVVLFYILLMKFGTVEE